MKITFTGLQPTGELTIGNYIGSLINFDETIKGSDESFLCVVDLHSISNKTPEPKILNENIRKSLAMYIALGLDKKTNIFLQSHVAGHSQLQWILTCFTKNGELDRMTQYKDKKNESTSTGLYTYPILMAADILLYNSTHIPVGMDQKQHVELCRDIATRFNSTYNKEVFTLPEPVINKEFKKIYSLVDPSKKMSKSDENPKAYISLFDEPKVILKKIKSAQTDSLGEINYDYEKQPGVTNLLTIYSAMKNISIEETLNHFSGQNYGFLKNEVANSVIEVLEPLQKKYNEILQDDELLRSVCKKGASVANEHAQKKIQEVYDVVGFY